VIICALEEWQHYIQGSGHTTNVLSDHQNLTIYDEARKLNRQQAWWFLFLSEYDIKLIHTPGNKMIESDALSWRPDHCVGDDTDNTDVVMLPADVFIKLINLDLQERIVDSEILDKDTKGALTLLSEQRPDTLRNWTEDWMVELFHGMNIVFYKGKNYIPLNPRLWHDIVESFHDNETAGHPGELKMYNTIWQHYWWPGLWTFTRNYVQGCGICQQLKINWSLSKPMLCPLKGWNWLDLSWTVLWTWLLTCHWQRDLTLSCLW